MTIGIRYFDHPKRRTMATRIVAVSDVAKRWWAWRTVSRARIPERERQVDRCPFCGSELVEVTTPVPVYPHDPETEERPEPTLRMMRCGGCQRYQTGEMA